MIAIEQDFVYCAIQVGSNLSLSMKPKRVTIQTKAIEQHFHVELFIILNTLVLTISLWMKP